MPSDKKCNPQGHNETRSTFEIKEIKHVTARALYKKRKERF